MTEPSIHLAGLRLSRHHSGIKSVGTEDSVSVRTVERTTPSSHTEEEDEEEEGEEQEERRSGTARVQGGGTHETECIFYYHIGSSGAL